MEDYKITMNNQRIYTFYKENPNIQIETMNILLIDFLQNIGKDISQTMSHVIFGEIQSDIKHMKTEVKNLNDTFAVKLHEHNREYIENIKNYIALASNDNNEKMVQVLDKNTESFMNKMKSSIPNSSDIMKDQLKQLHESMKEDIRGFVSSTNKEQDYKGFIDSIDSKITTLQQPIYNAISVNQEKMDTKLQDIKNEAHLTKQSNDSVIQELNQFLSKYKTSSQYKGQFSENMLETTLNQMYPTGEVKDTRSHKAAGDFMLFREEQDTIMIENKNYESNVNIDEIKKFLRDVNEQKTHAIMMSQFSGIATKPNGFIEIHDNKVIIYLHHVDYSSDKIKMAIDIIDNLSLRLNDIDTNKEGYTISKDSLERINTEYQCFIKQRESLQMTIKDMTKKLSSQLDSLKLPNLSHYLSDKFASLENTQFICDVCNMQFQTKRSLASHKKIHKK